MNNRYPLLLKPVIKDYLWGGTRLKEEFGLDAEGIAAEGWMLSCHRDGTNTVLNGEYAGKPLDEVLAVWGMNDPLPIIIKLIDAADKLSVQVHPDNAYAQEHEGDNGKTEMWYVVDCKPNAQLIYGFDHAISREELEAHINANTLGEVVNTVPVKKGDIFFIPAGTLHAIGEGILIAEVQQNSNTTYRVSDYGRLGVDGKPRELHVQKALDVTNTVPPTVPYGAVGEITQTAYGTERLLAECPYFTTKHVALCGTTELAPSGNFVSVLCLSGSVEIAFGTDKFSMEKGGSLYIPHGCPVTIEGEAELLLAY